MLIPSIHVGCGDFSLQRLEVLANENFFNPVACVDIDVKNARNKLSKNGEFDESIHMKELEINLEKGCSPADSLIKKFNTSWNESIEPIYKDLIF